jgi:hypothetical protein
MTSPVNHTHTPRYWSGKAPPWCELCERPFMTDVFIDGKTIYGSWGYMCESCHTTHGIGLGIGRGQEYTKQSDGRWMKTSA